MSSSRKSARNRAARRQLARRKSTHRKSTHRKSTHRKAARHRRAVREKAGQAHRERPQTPTRLKVRRPDDLLAVIPYLLGFHPDESLVAVFVRSGRVILTARMDLLPEADDELAEQIDLVAKREGSQALALVAYSAGALSANRLLTRLRDRLAEHDLTDVIYVGHGRWWSLTCGDECCPLAGTPLDLTSHPLSAAAVLAGLVTRANREELEASIGGPLPAELPRLQSITETLLSEVTQLDEAGAGVRVMLSMLDTAVADPNSLDERTCLLLGLMLRRIELRDRAWMLINPANADDHVRLWGAVVARVPPTLAAAPLCLLGMAAWLDGEGALLNCCCGRLAVVAPDYSLGTLLAEISERALPPSIWQELGGEVQGRSQKHPAPLAS